VDPNVPVNKKASKSQDSSPSKRNLSSAKAQKPTLSVVDISSSEDDQPLMLAKQEKSTPQVKDKHIGVASSVGRAAGRCNVAPNEIPTVSEYVIYGVYSTLFEIVHFTGLWLSRLIVVLTTQFLVTCMAVVALLIGVI